MRRRSALTVMLAALVVVLIVPAAVVAAPPEESCAGERSIAHSMPIPDAMRTQGVHRFERRFTYHLTDGTTADGGTASSQIELAAGAPVFDNVLLRVVRNWGLRADGSIDRDVQTIGVGQPGAFYSQVAWAKDDPIVTVVEELRYETRKNRWTDWIVVPAGPVVSFCVELNDSIIRKSFGWVG